MKPLWTFFCGLIVFACLFAGCGKKSGAPGGAAANAEEEFLALMNSGKNYFNSGSATQAVTAFESAVKLQPTQGDARLNLANAQLLAGNAEVALKEAREVIALDNDSSAAHFVAGCALNRLGQFLEAVKELQTSRDLDPSVATTSFQLGMAHLQLKQYQEAADAFQAAIDLEPEHLSAHYNLSQALARLGRDDESKKELEAHQAILANYKGPQPTVATFEKSRHTEPRVPFKLEQPEQRGIAITFKDQTVAMLGEAATNYVGPVGIIDINHRGANDLFVLEGGKNFRLLLNTNGTFKPVGQAIAAIAGNKYHKMLVADLQNDRFDDVIAVGEKGIQVFGFLTNGAFVDSTAFTRLQGLGAIDAVLVDLDFTGKLDLLAVTATNDVRVFRNLGNLFFRDITATSGVPAGVKGARRIISDDWNGDDIMDFAIARDGSGPLAVLKQRGGPLAQTNAANWPAASLIASGDLNNDTRMDAVFATRDGVEVRFNGVDESRIVGAGTFRALKVVDYDNDGWLDIIAATDKGLRGWRNLGQTGFTETTSDIGFLDLKVGLVSSIHCADVTGDCASDLLLATDGGLKIFRNEGGSANRQIKVRLFGNRSNASGLGVKLEAQTGGLRTLRTVQELPIEIGIGKYAQVETLTTRWFDLAVPSIDVKAECTNLLIAELILPTGSCPYLYVWDGTKHRFVTDLLGAAPIGLPVAEGRYIEADPDEFVWIGNETNFKPLNGAYQAQITEELREVLYLDEAKLVVVDHPEGTEVVSTDKLVPGKPFPPGGIMTLGARKALVAARTLEGADVTQALNENDRVMVSPAKLHIPQRRGMAERHGVELDFGALDVKKPLTLALTGWLRFGGGMANIAASHLPDLPFPFPVLEVERAGKWEKVNVTAGAPAGKTKTIVIDLEGKLPEGARKLRLTAGFEIHWDRIALFEKAGEANTRVTTLAADSSDLHWRGFSEFEDLPWTQPLTPMYDTVFQEAKWRVNVSGWCTRYGAVDELIAKRDDALVLLNGGDELTLRFDEKRVPGKSASMVRDFFLYTDGWDKDADFHVAEGTRVEPLPWHGMDDQLYGQEARPAGLADGWIAKYNTRWVGPETLKRGGAVAKRP
jgi:tetratricopeptide (TPR) repeat protein